MMTKLRHTAIVVLITAAGIASAGGTGDINDIARSYVQLVLEVGLHDPPYVDTYFGPAEWKPSDANVPDAFPADRLRGDVEKLIKRLDGWDSRPVRGIEGLRRSCCANN